MSESKKFYVLQVAPECQESPLDWLDMDDIYPDVNLVENRYYHSHTTEVYDNVSEVLMDSYFYYYIEDVENHNEDCEYSSKREVVEDFFKKEDGTFTDEEVNKIIELSKSFAAADRTDEKEIIAGVLSIITGHDYCVGTIRGVCQSDWQNIIYPEDKYSDEFIKIFECEYFNTGSEWIVHDEDTIPKFPNEVSGYGIYTHDYCFGKTCREELAQQIGCKPEDIVMWEVSGSHQVIDYKLDA